MTHPHGKNYFLWWNNLQEKNVYEKIIVKGFLSRPVAMGSSFKAVCFFVVCHAASHLVLRPPQSTEVNTVTGNLPRHDENATRTLTFMLPYTSSIDLKVEECLERKLGKKNQIEDIRFTVDAKKGK